jgi:hypothetical protein
VPVGYQALLSSVANGANTKDGANVAVGFQALQNTNGAGNGSGGATTPWASRRFSLTQPDSSTTRSVIKRSGMIPRVLATPPSATRPALIKLPATTTSISAQRWLVLLAKTTPAI